MSYIQSRQNLSTTAQYCSIIVYVYCLVAISG